MGQWTHTPRESGLTPPQFWVSGGITPGNLRKYRPVQFGSFWSLKNKHFKQNIQTFQLPFTKYQLVNYHLPQTLANYLVLDMIGNQCNRKCTTPKSEWTESGRKVRCLVQTDSGDWHLTSNDVAVRYLAPCQPRTPRLTWKILELFGFMSILQYVVMIRYYSLSYQTTIVATLILSILCRMCCHIFWYQFLA